VRERDADANARQLWAAIEAIGGETGWYSPPWAWQARGIIDRIVGGVGLRRGRRDPRRLRVGDAVDFWRVEELLPGRLLRLRAEMRLPGLAWLELRVDDETERGRVRYRQRAVFHPRGLAGQLYWWSLKPFHGIVFGAMARNITRAAQTPPTATATQSPDTAQPPPTPPHPAPEPATPHAASNARKGLSPR
jgi:hypothetical protein